MNRRDFLLSAAAAATPRLSFLRDRASVLAWFREAKFGLFIHYGLYSLEGRGEWLQYVEKIPIAEYAKLASRFTADKFDAGKICDLALEAGMRYVNLVTKHCDSFCLWDTRETEFNTMNTPARRDLVAEMAEACRKRGLGLFLFYEHGFDWRHPHGPAPWDWKARSVRPAYDPPDPFYAPRERYDFNNYLRYVSNQITELLTQYGPVAGVWLDGAGIPHSGDKSKFRLPELYALIRKLQPQALISYKWGVNGDEDFLAPEETQLAKIRKEGNTKPVEICATLQKRWWGYCEKCERRNADEVMAKLREAAQWKANLLLNTGPVGDGSIHPDEIAVLREVGRRLRREGFPKA